MSHLRDLAGRVAHRVAAFIFCFIYLFWLSGGLDRLAAAPVAGMSSPKNSLSTPMVDPCRNSLVTGISELSRTGLTAPNPWKPHQNDDRIPIAPPDTISVQRNRALSLEPGALIEQKALMYCLDVLVARVAKCHVRQVNGFLVQIIRRIHWVGIRFHLPIPLFGSVGG